MNLKIIDEIIRVDDKECFLVTRALVREEGIFAGGSSGAAVAGAIRYAEALGDVKKNILVLLPDSAQKYLSKIFDDNWMQQNGFLEEPDPLGTVSDLMRTRQERKLITINRGDSLKMAIGLLQEHGVSQLPVLDGGRLVGLVSELDLLNHLLSNPGQLAQPIDELVEADYATVTPQTKVKLLRTIFNEAKAVFVLEGDTLVDVITKIDLIEYLATRSG
jgi:cystathionine beta-synthase